MKPVFVHTANVRNFIALMTDVEQRIGHDSLAMVWGRAGRGKTRTAKWYATKNKCVYVTSLRDWSSLWMYQDILKALGVQDENIPKRKKQCFEMIVQIAEERRQPFLLDEADLLGSRLLESVRDLCKVTSIPWVLIGEESLPGLMNRDRRVWSRRCASLEFQPMDIPDIVGFAHKGADLELHVNNADTIQRETGGDIRLIELVITKGESIAKANSSRELTADIIAQAMKIIIPEKSR
ncbi:MAG: ATP-binding protein [Spirochaetes bacterium]|nr:ATP-binding protein [Spirochaetota bacterium]